MILNAYSIYDLKGQFYSAPFFHQNDGIAGRGFGDLVNDKRSNINKHPADYSLFKIGTYDDSNGQLIATKPEQIVQGAGVFIDPMAGQPTLPGIPAVNGAESVPIAK